MKKSMLYGTLFGAAMIIFVTAVYPVCHQSENRREVVYYTCKRPEIYDRSGNLLIGNCTRKNSGKRVRYAAVNGKFAAGLLGFTEFDRGREIGKSGIEKIIDRKSYEKSVSVSIDSGVQKVLESWMEKLLSNGKYQYTYAVCLNSQGELLAAAQRPVVDINDRSRFSGGACFMPSVFVFPITEEFMRLLGSSLTAPVAEKEKFQLHCKSGLFFPEARGWITPPKTGEVPAAATAFNYILAYIKVAEGKPMPQLQIFSNGKQPAVVWKSPIEWLAASQVKNEVAVLGKAGTEHGKYLYFLVCAKTEEPQSSKKTLSEITKF